MQKHSLSTIFDNVYNFLQVEENFNIIINQVVYHQRSDTGICN